eukprot:3306841-Rhodomonas_salina.1
MTCVVQFTVLTWARAGQLVLMEAVDNHVEHMTLGDFIAFAEQYLEVRGCPQIQGLLRGGGVRGGMQRERQQHEKVSSIRERMTEREGA